MTLLQCNVSATVRSCILLAINALTTGCILIKHLSVRMKC